MIKVNTYIRIYGEDAVVNCVIDPKNKWISTIFNKGWVNIFSAYKKSNTITGESNIEVVDPNIKPTKQFGKKSKTQRLRDLDES